MVVATAAQLRSSYLLWERFSMPTEDGSVGAIAVPVEVSEQLISAYTILVAMIFTHVWGIVIALGTLWAVRTRAKENQELTAGLWNTRDALPDAFRDVVAYMFARKRFRSVLLYFLLIIIAILYVGHTALSVIIPSMITLGNTAPVNPNAIFIPPRDDSSSDVEILQAYNLETPAGLRAIGSARVADQELRSKVRVSEPRVLEDLDNGERVQRIDYSYNVTAVDFGLGGSAGLELRVQGACTTEYDWFLNTTNGGDNYQHPFEADGKQIRLSTLLDGRMPIAFFMASNETDRGNVSWAAFISSLNRLSWTVGQDPWYLTAPWDDADLDAGDAPNIVRSGRPGLSCWQKDEWWYGDEWRPVLELDELPGLNIKAGPWNSIYRWLSEPKVVPLATRLGTSALVSTGSTLGAIIDANSCSMHNDLEQLILAAYISTSNLFTDMTLFPNPPSGMRNAALDETGQLLDGTADFVVWTPHVEALSIRFIILIPAIALGVWIITLVVLFATPIRKMREFGAMELYHQLLCRPGPDGEVAHGDGEAADDQETKTPMANNTTTTTHMV